MNNAIEITGLSKKYDGFKLENINIVLPKGYIMGFIGENGAGKTTVIKAMTGLIRYDSGDIKLFGESFKNIGAAVRENIGVVMDDYGLPPQADTKDINKIMKGIYSTWNSRAFFRYTEKFGLPQNKRIKSYSTGMKRKLSIAVALSHNSRLLILDEATSGLDPVARDELLDILREFIQDEDNSVFISSHILSDLEKVCDYITLIHEGRIVFSDEKDELLASYAIARCTVKTFENINKSAVVAFRRTEFGIEALVKRQMVNEALITDNATVEDIMVMMIKEEKR